MLIRASYLGSPCTSVHSLAQIGMQRTSQACIQACLFLCTLTYAYVPNINPWRNPYRNACAFEALENPK